ncbi:MAG: complex I subunit 5 family protein, partial [Prosthecobacter sp.]|nr:complex I subunit 5 family protein [Prosthecobacter sp.]
LVAHERTPSTERAARIYIILAIAGETSLLLGLIISSAGAESMSISHVSAALIASPWRWEATLALLVGFGLKAGLVPLHVWLPLAHSAAPTPASAVLSGVIVKAGIIGLIRFLPVGDVFSAWSVAIVWLGLATTFYGAVAGLLQSNPKVILAYSTMSQMGLIVAVIGAGMSSSDPGNAHGAAALYATHHGLAKAALFLAFGIIATSDGFRRQGALVLAAIIGAALAGLPFTGGALAKLAVKGPMGDGAAALMASLSAVLTMLLITRFIAMAAQSESPNPNTRAAPHLLMTFAFYALAVAALAVPWFLFPSMGGHSVSYAVTQAAIWDAGWPIAAALLIAGAFWALRLSLPNAPVGDIVLVAERLVQALQTVSQRRAPWHGMSQLHLRGPALPMSDVFLPWAACTAALAGIGIALAIIMAIGGG